MDKQTKILWVGLLVVLIIAIGGYNYPQISKTVQDTAQKLAGVTNYDQMGVGPATVSFYKLSVPAGTSTTYFYNRTGHSLFIDELALTTTGTASSSYRIFAYASTSVPFSTNPATWPYVALASQPDKALINGFVLATSSVATTTNSLYEMAKGVGGHGIVELRAGEYLDIILQSYVDTGGGTLAPQALCSGAIGGVTYCESATSTNRGFNITGLVKFFATSTASNPTIE